MLITVGLSVIPTAYFSPDTNYGYTYHVRSDGDVRSGSYYVDDSCSRLSRTLMLVMVTMYILYDRLEHYIEMMELEVPTAGSLRGLIALTIFG